MPFCPLRAPNTEIREGPLLRRPPMRNCLAAAESRMTFKSIPLLLIPTSISSTLRKKRRCRENFSFLGILELARFFKIRSDELQFLLCPYAKLQFHLLQSNVNKRPLTLFISGKLQAENTCHSRWHASEMLWHVSVKHK